MRGEAEPRTLSGGSPRLWHLIASTLLITLITASHLDQVAPTVARILQVLAHGSALLAVAWLPWPSLSTPAKSARAFFHAYNRTILRPLALYFAGLIIGSPHGPQLLCSLWQTPSNAQVFAFAFLVFGWWVNDLDRTVHQFLGVVAVWTGILLLGDRVRWQLGRLVAGQPLLWPRKPRPAHADQWGSSTTPSISLAC